MSILLGDDSQRLRGLRPGNFGFEASPMAARTSGGRFVEVCVISSIRLSLKKSFV